MNLSLIKYICKNIIQEISGFICIIDGHNLLENNNFNDFLKDPLDILDFKFYNR